jgi:hypothetical protein
MLQLRYNLKRDRFQYATVFGDPAAISNLYWQLTHNYAAQDGQEIGEIKVLDMAGVDVTEEVLVNPFGAGQRLTTIER